MDQRADRGRAGHGVGKPDVERNLGRFARRADQQQQRDRRDPARRGVYGQRLGLRKHLAEVERAEVNRDQKNGKREAEVADAVDDERLVSRRGGEVFQKIEADQQVAAQAHSFPSDKQQQEVGGQHQRQHEEHEQVEIGEEAVVAALMGHVADGVNMDQRADAGDDHQHHGGEAVDREIDANVQRAGLNPGEVMLDVGFLEAARERAERAERFQHP